MEDFKSALLDFVKFQNAQQLQFQERTETQQLQLKKRIEKLPFSNSKRKSREKWRETAGIPTKTVGLSTKIAEIS